MRLPLLAAALTLAMPAHAQDAQDNAPIFSLPPATPPPSTDTRRQGPEIDVFRPSTTTATPPPVITPPVINPTVTPVPVPTPARPGPTTARPANTKTDATAKRPSTSPEREPAAPVPSSTPVQDAAPQPADALPPPVLQNESQPDTPTPPGGQATNAPSSQTPWPWIIGGALLLMTGLAALWLRRRPAPQAEWVESAPVDDVPAHEPVGIERAKSEPARPETAAQPLPAPPPAPVAPPTPVAPAADRPWLDIALHVTQARYSLMGVTVGYSLIIHNRGDRPARNVLVRGMVGNADAAQQAQLQSFFAGQIGMPLHSSASIEPGVAQRLDGELRLLPDQIVPVSVGQRSLLIPLAAFDVTYDWGEEDGNGIETGRTARAFIVGQEQEPPADRLAPLRLDQGPRHYRRPAARAAGELTPV